MQTDFDKLKAIFRNAGVEFEEVTSESILEENTFSTTTYNQKLTIKQGFGYWGMRCTFYFIDGKLTGHAVWE